MPAWISHIDFWTVAAVGISLALATLGALVSIYDQWAKKHRKMMVAGFVALGIVGTTTAIVAAAKSSKELQDATAKITDAVHQGDNKLLSYQTGGDSYCYAVPDPLVAPRPHRINFMVVHKGTYPLHDIKMFFIDRAKAINLTLAATTRGITPDMQQLKAQATHYLELKTLWSDYEQISFNHDRLKTSKQIYDFTFSAPNGEWRETFLLDEVNGKQVHAMRVFRGEPQGSSDAILKDIDSEFPTPIEW